MLYVEYATQRIIETFPLSEEEKRQLFHFRDAVKTLLTEAQRQAREKLAALYKAISEGTYRVEGKRLYAPDGVWMYIDKTVMYISVHGVSAVTHFPNVLKLPHKRLELLQLGWRASDEGEADGRPFMQTAQPWQMFAWAAARYGELRVYIASISLTREGVSVAVRIKARNWRQSRNKNEAINLVVDFLRRGEWTPVLTMWLGDGEVNRRRVLSGDYQLIIAAKEPWRLGLVVNTCEALVASGKEAFVKLREAAGAYGELLDLLKAHKWLVVKLATDDGFRATLKQNKNVITVVGVVMYLRLVNGSLLADYYTRDVGKALEVADKLKAAGLRPNVVKSGPNYEVYIAMGDLLRLAERDEAIRKALALYLAEKVKNGTPRQREIAEKILKRNPLFQTR
jgi:hypothetical protein